MHNVNLHKRDIQIGSRTISLETGKLAKQADGSVLVRSGDTVVLVTACHAATAREGIDFLPLTVDYREYTLCVRAHSRRLLQARRQAVRKGSADQPSDRSAHPSAVRRRAGATRRRSSRCCCRPTPRTTADVLAITGASAALALSEIPFEKTIAGRTRRPDRRRLRHQSDLRRAQAKPRSISSSPAAATAS